MNHGIVNFQVGKQGVTEGIADSLSLIFRTHKTVRISFLKSSGRDRDKIKEMGDELSAKIAEKLPGRYPFSIIGFTIIMKRRSLTGKH